MSQHGPDLGDALAALRELGDEGGGNQDTRDRVLMSLDHRDARRRTFVAWAVVAAICFTGGTSWAWFSGWLPAVVRRIVDPAAVVAPEAPKATPQAPAVKRPRKPTAPIVVAEPTVVVPPPVPVPVPVPVPDPAPVAAVVPRPRRVHAVAPGVVAEELKIEKEKDKEPGTGTGTGTGTGPEKKESEEEKEAGAGAGNKIEAVPDLELRAYRTAHAAHFRGTDPARALSAWDDYLAQFPHGVLAPEGRWNRALVLVRLGRNADALAALEPFAATPGGFRQRDAARLVEAIRARAAATPQTRDSP